MTHEAYGGIEVRTVGVSETGYSVLASAQYDYRLLNLANQDVQLTDLEAFTALLLDKSDDGNIEAKALHAQLDTGDCLRVEREPLVLSSVGGRAHLLVAGVRQTAAGVTGGIELVRHGGHYKVHKPWGYELWLSGEHPRYAFKMIFIRAGTVTSLQYHRKKRETNFLVEGTARLHYKCDPAVPNDEVQRQHLATAEIGPHQAIDVAPWVLHRLEAVTDLLLCEASTPELDDVVRVQDDSGRGDGRIATEHKWYEGSGPHSRILVAK